MTITKWRQCHRSIYGKWKAVLDYFSEAKVLGLTATPTPEAYAFFDNNIIEEYTYDESVVDGVNVPSRIYRIATEITEHGGSIKSGTIVTETARKSGQTTAYVAPQRFDYDNMQLDRSVVNRDQIRKVLLAYKKRSSVPIAKASEEIPIRHFHVLPARSLRSRLPA